MTDFEDAEEILSLLAGQEDIEHCSAVSCYKAYLADDDWCFVCEEHSEWFFDYELEDYSGDEPCHKVNWEHLLP